MILRFRWRVLMVGAAVGLVAGQARADVIDFVIFKSRFYNQTSDAAPVSPTSFAFAADLNVTDAGDLNAAAVTYPGALSPLTMTPFGTGYHYTSGFLASEAQMDTDYPDGATYQFDISGGTLGAQSATITLPASPRYAGSIPSFTGGVFSALQGIDPSLDVTLSWDGYATVTGTNRPLAFLTVYDATANAVVFTNSFDNAAQSVFLPGGTFQPLHNYSATLYYSSRSVTANAGFGSATSEIAADLTTTMTFTAGSGLSTSAPEPGTAALTLLGVAFGGVLLRRRRG